MKLFHYIRTDDGTVVPEPNLNAWVRWVSTHDIRVAYTQITEDIEVSTIFLSIDLANFNLDKDATPQLFETMVLGGPFDQEQRRYATQAEALQGHNALVRRVQEALDLPSSKEDK